MYQQEHVLLQFNDALITTPFGSDWLAKVMKCAAASSAKTNKVKNFEMRVGDWVVDFSMHKEGSKDGRILIPGEVDGNRRHTKNIKAMHLMFFDIDNGQSFDEVEKRLTGSGVAYLMYTSHSHGKTTTATRLDHIVSSLNLQADATLTLEVVQRYLTDEKGFADAVVRSVQAFDIVQVSHRQEVRIYHGPMDKFRVCFILQEPFRVNDYQSRRAAQAAWAAYMMAVADWAGLSHDHACHDLARGFYFPRHAPGRPYAVRVGGSRTLDLDQFVPVMPAATSRQRTHPVRTTSRSVNTGKTLPHAGRRASPIESGAIDKLLRQAGDKLDLVKLLVDRIGWETRGTPTLSKAVILCPNDDAHSNPGDADDMACVVMNPDATDARLGVITCRHEHCRGLRTGDFLNMIFDQIDIGGTL